MSENNLNYENPSSMKDYVDNQYKEWQEKYDIPYEDEFNVKLLLQLRYDILTTKPEYTKTKLELIAMANSIQSRLRLKENSKDTNNYRITSIKNMEIKHNGASCAINFEAELADILFNKYTPAKISIPKAMMNTKFDRNQMQLTFDFLSTPNSSTLFTIDLLD